MAPVFPAEAPRPRPHRGGSLPKPTLDLAIISIILGGVGFLASPGIAIVRLVGVFPPVLVGLAVLGIGGFGLFLAILAMTQTVSEKMHDFWYVLCGMILSGLAILCGLTVFIAALAIGSVHF
jgi:hypothetical protein